MTNHDEQMKAVARLVSGRPDWIDAPAVQAWHRSDGRTEHDGGVRVLVQGQLERSPFISYRYVSDGT